MSGSGDTLVLSQSLSGDLTFSSGPAPITDVTIEPTALSYALPTSGNIIQTELGGNIDNFEPGDTIVLANLEQDFANFASLAGPAATMRVSTMVFRSRPRKVCNCMSSQMARSRPTMLP